VKDVLLYNAKLHMV